jgi:hypothetical protein
VKVVTSQSPATLRSRVVVQAASDLDDNRRRQQELAEKIRMLKQEEALLVDILALAERYEGSVNQARVPEQTQEGPTRPEKEPRPRSTAADSTGTPPRRKTRTGTPKTKSAAKGKERQPLLGDILLELLGAHSEPRLAKELREELLEKHPGRKPTPQVVRNTLESLVAKGRIRRHKQQRSVMYTVVGPADM